MRYDDRITISTPEGVDLELLLAGVGSRFASAIVDFVIQSVLLAAFAILTLGLGTFGGGGLGFTIFTVLSFLLFAGYDIAFEVLASGRTPGKRLNGLRVVRDNGSPIGFLTSSVRNVLRLVDLLPTAYLVGIVSILVTSKNQRLGDLAAGTLVVRERGAELAPVVAAPAATAAGAVDVSWDVSAITAEELAAVRTFLARRRELTPGARSQLAAELSEALRQKVAGVPETVQGEPFLEQLAAAKTAR